MLWLFLQRSGYLHFPGEKKVRYLLGHPKKMSKNWRNVSSVERNPAEVSSVITFLKYDWRRNWSSFRINNTLPIFQWGHRRGISVCGRQGSHPDRLGMSPWSLVLWHLSSIRLQLHWARWPSSGGSAESQLIHDGKMLRPMVLLPICPEVEVPSANFHSSYSSRVDSLWGWRDAEANFLLELISLVSVGCPRAPRGRSTRDLAESVTICT